MKCIGELEIEVSKEELSHYDLLSIGGVEKFILEKKDGFAPLFSNELFNILGGETEGNKVKKIMFDKVDDIFTLSTTMDETKVIVPQNIKFYCVDGMFSLLTSFVPLEKILPLLRKDPCKLEKIFDRVEKYIIDYITDLSKKGVTHISYADPSVLPQILGNKYTGWIITRLVNLLKNLSHLDLVIHLCPILLDEMKEHGEAGKTDNYQENILLMDGFIVTSGSCIKNKNSGKYYLFSKEDL